MNNDIENEVVIITKKDVKSIFDSSQATVDEMLEIYECMSESEQRAFDWGVAYRSALSTRSELEEILRR